MVGDTTIWLTAQDYNRLRVLLGTLSRQSREAQAGVTALEEILDSARVVRPDRVPGNVVTMNSEVLYEDLHTGRRRTATIVYPSEADAASGRISVLSPVGGALLGETEGSQVELPLPNGQTRSIRIQGVLYQPEAQGNFAL